MGLFQKKNAKNTVRLLPDPGTPAVDAFRAEWSRISAYAFPPFNMLEKVSAKAVRESERERREREKKRKRN